MDWQAADDTWRQRTAMVHHLIISGLPNLVLMLCMHLETPCETFAYLKNRYGSIPRPESLKVIDEALQQCNMPSEQCTTARSAQSTCDGHNEPEIPAREEDGSSDSPNGCTKTKTGQTKPEAKVVDTWQVVDILSMFEDGNADQEWLEHASTLEAPDERSQHTADEVAKRRNLPMWSPEACEPAGDTAKWTSKRSIGFTPKMYLGQNQSLPTSGKTILDVPGPPLPDARIKCPIPQDNSPARMCSTMTTAFNLSHARRHDKQ
ncbi:hypothetical protein EDC04DRAFT_2893554 [Pisolithus marmoratus]|nr:hypothetical protein EDC04DRAFT_2893554 [Pisolithus marmoratus]